VSAGVHNFNCEQGSTFTRTVTVKDNAGTVRDLTGFTAKMQVRRDIEDSTVIIELSTSNGGISITSATGGIMQLSLSSTQTAALTLGGVYDLELVNSSGAIERLLRGEFVLDKEVTR
jgi:hypothetical protein